MKKITFGTAMAPHGVGDSRLVSADVAHDLEGQGVLSSIEDWPAAAGGPSAVRPARPTLKPLRGGAQVRDNRKAR